MFWLRSTSMVSSGGGWRPAYSPESTACAVSNVRDTSVVRTRGGAGRP
jgi:hypothetical protein